MTVWFLVHSQVALGWFRPCLAFGLTSQFVHARLYAAQGGLGLFDATQFVVFDVLDGGGVLGVVYYTFFGSN